MTKNVRNVFVMLGVALLAVLGFVAMTSPAQAKAPVAAVAAATTTPAPARGYCIKVGTGEFRNLWLTPEGKCPIYTPKTDEYWGPVSLGGTVGPKGDKGDKGDPGDSKVSVVHKVVTLTSASASPQVVVVSGVPAFNVANAEGNWNNAGSSPLGSTVTVTPVKPAAGDVTRSFTVTQTGLGGNSFALDISVLTAL